MDERIIFSGNLFQYQEDSKKWRNRFSLVPHNYGLVLYENKVVRPPAHPSFSQAWPGRFFPFSTASPGLLSSTLVDAARPPFLSLRLRTSTRIPPLLPALAVARATAEPQQPPPTPSGLPIPCCAACPL